jgi:hypothetical protein
MAHSVANTHTRWHTCSQWWAVAQAGSSLSQPLPKQLQAACISMFHPLGPLLPDTTQSGSPKSARLQAVLLIHYDTHAMAAACGVTD